MAEYIEREAVLAEADYDGNYMLVVPAKKVRNIPSADVAPVVHGRWENMTIAIVDTTGYCGVCRKQAVWRSRNKPYAICPYCGARMEGDG